MENIRAGNLIYTAQRDTIYFLSGALEASERQSLNLILAYDECRNEVAKGEIQLDLKDRKLQEAEKIIKIQKTKTGILGGMAVIIIAFLIVN